MKLFVAVVMFVVVPVVFAEDFAWKSVPDWPLLPDVNIYQSVPIPQENVTQSAEPQVNGQSSQQNAQGTLSSLGPQPPANSYQAQCAACDDKKDEELQIYRDGNAIQRELVGIGRLTLGSQIILSALQVFVAVWALLISQRSRRTAETARRAANRAALAVQRYQLTNLQEDGKAEATCFLANVGQTPAVLIKSCTGSVMEIDVPPPIDPETTPPTWTGEKNVYPGEALVQAVGPLPIRTAERKLVQRKSHFIFFYGYFVYRDVVGGTEPHVTVFFVQYDYDRGIFSEVERPGYNYRT
jgi:hypothetical protein